MKQGKMLAAWRGAALLLIMMLAGGLLAPGVGAKEKRGGLSPAVVGYPNAMASTGDSITRGFNTGAIPFTDSPGNSWTTGTNSAVLSHYSRILAANPAINGHNNNDGVTGAVMADLLGQVANVNSQQVDYVTVLLGANDACKPTEGEMTSVATYRAQLDAALASLSAGSPNARIYLVSVPNVYNLWSILHGDSNARSTWGLFSICQSMLANPDSQAPADVARRDRVRARVVDYNTQLATACANYIHCRFDNNTLFNTTFVPSDVSTRDYFHPTIAGQAKLALVTYPAGYNFTDNVAPVSTALIGPSPDSTQLYSVQFSATDNVGVAGIEYKLGAGPWTRYDGPLTLPRGTTLTYRAVDVNGNSEAAHVITLP